LVEILVRADKRPTQLCPLHAAKEVPVPNMVGLSLDAAQDALQQAGFRVSLVEDPTSSAPTGTVVDQNPAAGTAALQRGVVALVVSAAPPSTTVPDMVGLDVAAARAELAAVGLIASESSTPDEAIAGTVLAQDPAAGTVVRAGSTVRLVLSAGPGGPSSS
jgi:beta-lactam-binding protein with PASTA domain